MTPRKTPQEPRMSLTRSHKSVLLLVVLAAACMGVIFYGQRFAQAPDVERGAGQLPTTTPAPIQKEIAEFRMTDLDHGWLRYSDGVVKVTDDGGEHWKEAATGLTGEVPASTGGGSGGASTDHGEWNGKLNEEPKLTSILYQSEDYQVKQSQFLTDRIGWALLSNGVGLQIPLLVTVDGGQTWHAEVTPDVKNAMQEEKMLQQQIRKEAVMYESPEYAKLAIRSEWVLLPSNASPGDVVLVRHNKPGEVVWQGKTYPLQSFGAGYFTYLPIPMQVKPGEYPIGDQVLTIKEKKFETQYLQVSKQMESMRQDTKRIQEDQKKIDLARSKSQPEFLFTSAFVQPIEGILTTPYGYTRYVNGKYDSSHLAIDLAAKEGTPIKATNDGIVALADSLYLTGNSIYIDHGMGLFSQYAHLSELRVKTGDRVKRGDIIGLVGTTGFSTGPHLHFTFWAHNVPVNPNLFFDTTPFQWLKN